MAPIIPSGGKKMSWVRDPEAVEKKAQSDMFEDDPQLNAIKDLPGMQDGIAELEDMSTEIGAPAGDIPPADMAPIGAGSAACPAECPAAGAGGAVEQAIERVKDAAQGVADAAVKDVEKAVTDAVKNVGVAPVSDTLDDIKPEGDKAHEDSETPAEEAKEEHEKGESPSKEKAEEGKDIPGVEGDAGGIEKEGDEEGDKDKKGEKPCPFAAAKGMRRLAELSGDETKELRHYWKDLLGFPPEYVDAMLKKYRA